MPLVTLTWDRAAEDGGAARPTLEELGGAEHVDDIDEPPHVPEQPSAEPFNQLEYQVAAIAKMVGACALTIDFDAGDPFVAAVTGCRTEIAAEDFTIVDNGDGDTSIRWAAGFLPPPTVDPTVSVNELSDSNPVVVYESGNLGINVLTYTGGVLTDCRFTVVIR